MDFRLTEDQELLLSSLKELINRDFPEEYFRKCDKEYKYPIEFFNALGENGFSMLGVPEELGGVPADMVTQMMVIEEVGRQGAPSYLMLGAHAVDNMLEFGSREQLAKTVASVEKGVPGYSLCFTEPQAGSDNSLLATTYTRKNGKVRLNGQKTFITGAVDYPNMLVMARNPEPEDPRRCYTMWFVNPKTPGIKVSPLYKAGWRMVSNCEVFFDNVEIEEKDMVGKEGWGFIQLMKSFEIERLTVAAYSLGAARCAFEDAVRYANIRVQFGKPIGSFQLIQKRICDMAVKIENMRNYVYKTAWEADNNISIRLSSALCKYYCAQTAQEVIDEAMQVMGGIGYTEESRISRLWRDIRVSRIGGGTDEIMIYIAGRQILQQYEN